MLSHAISFRFTSESSPEIFNGIHGRARFDSLVNLVSRLHTTFRRKLEEGVELCAFCRNNGEPYEFYVTHKYGAWCMLDASFRLANSEDRHGTFNAHNPDRLR
ncbi:unnamed protein product [Protopolystoma xenopodis]|uniref:Uncharacterized protein n=1 Tax=Protopolystoma xenopodis TaxID=117903 RepID=A0A3S5B1N3_9PLAT|nr:unnamed protein product [Protopolystoma xenopodis]